MPDKDTSVTSPSDDQIAAGADTEQWPDDADVKTADASDDSSDKGSDTPTPPQPSDKADKPDQAAIQALAEREKRIDQKLAQLDEKLAKLDSSDTKDDEPDNSKSIVDDSDAKPNDSSATSDDQARLTLEKERLKLLKDQPNEVASKILGILDKNPYAVWGTVDEMKEQIQTYTDIFGVKSSAPSSVEGGNPAVPGNGKRRLSDVQSKDLWPTSDSMAIANDDLEGIELDVQ